MPSRITRSSLAANLNSRGWDGIACYPNKSLLFDEHRHLMWTQACLNQVWNLRLSSRYTFSAVAWIIVAVIAL